MVRVLVRRFMVALRRVGRRMRLVWKKRGQGLVGVEEKGGVRGEAWEGMEGGGTFRGS